MHLHVSGQGRIAACSQIGNEPSVSIKSGIFIEKLINCQLIRNDCTPYSDLVLCSYSTDGAVSTAQPNETGRC